MTEKTAAGVAYSEETRNAVVNQKWTQHLAEMANKKRRTATANKDRIKEISELSTETFRLQTKWEAWLKKRQNMNLGSKDYDTATERLERYLKEIQCLQERIDKLIVESIEFENNVVWD